MKQFFLGRFKCLLGIIRCTFQVFAMPSGEYPITPSAMHLGYGESFLNAKGKCT